MHAQIGERVADFGALVEARAADDAIGQPERDEAVLEFAHLERGAHQDGDLVERMWPAALQLLDLLADGAGFFFGIPGAGDGDLLARHVVGAQRLAEPAFIVGDQMRGGGEDVAGGAVIALQPDHRGAGKIVLEAQDVVDLGAAPAIDRLVVVADAADVFRRAAAVDAARLTWRSAPARPTGGRCGAVRSAPGGRRRASSALSRCGGPRLRAASAALMPGGRRSRGQASASQRLSFCS